MNKLRTHYTGTTWCTLMTHRFKFWHASQNRNETIQDWEVQIRQAGSLCEYGDITDIMYRDKFVFGLCNNTIRTELLKTHLRPDNTPKALADGMRSKTNKLIIDRNKGIGEAVKWTGSGRSKSLRKKHRDMKLRREPSASHWCGDMKEPHK